jgi:hypothetical protein
MRRVIRAVVPLLVSCAALSTGGCLLVGAAAVAGATYGTVKYVENEAYRDFHSPVEPTWKATLEALRENGYAVGDMPAPQGAEGRIEIGDAKVVVERNPGDFTRVRVRIGAFDDEDHRRRAGLILESVGKRVS